MKHREVTGLEQDESDRNGFGAQLWLTPKAVLLTAAVLLPKHVHRFRGCQHTATESKTGQLNHRAR